MSEMAAPGATLEALEQLYRDRLAQFGRAAAAITRDESLGRDAVQEAFARRREARDLKGDAPLEAWVWRIVINEALALRRRRAAESRAAPAAAAALVTDDEPDHDVALRAWVAALPERQRLAVFLRYFADLDYRSIAVALDIEIGTVSTSLARAHAALRRSLEEIVR